MSANKSLAELDSKFWKELKKNAGIKKSGWFKKADAGIGGLIEDLNKARAKFQDSDLLEDLFKYQKCLDKLAAGFDKFIDKKHLDEIDDGDVKKKEKEELADNLKAWSKDINAAKDDLDKKLKKLIATVGDVKKVDAADKAKRREIWNKMGLDI